MTTSTVTLPEIGSVVRLRNRTWRVENIVSHDNYASNPIVELACYDDDAQGELLTVLWGVERNPIVLDEDIWKNIGNKGFDDPRHFSAFMHTIRWNCLTATDPKLYQSPFRAGIRLDPYQLEPLDKALQMPRVNLFIADDVGLGKTIEAGMIASELIIRKRVKEIVVAVPPNMLIQWQEEMESRFGMRFEILDRKYLDKIRQERGYAVNPWATFPRYLVSHKLLIDETYTTPLRDWLGSLMGNSLLILDEAHHAAPASGSKYAIDSRFTKVIRDLAPRFEHRLFLSATPHNGHSNSFSALLEILDPLRFTRGVKVVKKHVEEAIIRRLKEDIRQIEGGGFPERIVEPVVLDNLPEDQPELVLGALLDEYRSIRNTRMKEATVKEKNQFHLLMSGLQQRLFSSVSAFSRTVAVHSRTMEKIWANEQLAQISEVDEKALRGIFDSDDERSTWEDSDREALEESAIESATNITSKIESNDKEREILNRMKELSQNTKDLPDARVKYLISWIDKNMRADGEWNNMRLIIFTEYEDTRRYLMQSFQNYYGNDDSYKRIEYYSGVTGAQERERIKQDFNTDPNKTKLRILIATDAAREGLNLQSWCHHLFHFDIPWNPGRLEQRNGRIDRKLQEAPQVFCRYFIYEQRPEDRILDTLVRKTAIIHKELGSLSQVLETKMERLLHNGIQRNLIETLDNDLNSTDLDAQHKAVSQEELEDIRKRQDTLKTSVQTLNYRLENSRKKIGLDEEHLKDSIDCSLQLMNIDGMKASTKEVGQYLFPDLARQRGADPSWDNTLNTLRHKDQEDQSDLRPVVFTAPEQNDDDLIQLHLEHKLVKRLLSRFLCQGFLHHDLSRACLVQTKDSVPRVALLGRLSVYGSGASRLHEEIVQVTSRWIEPEKRETSRLQKYATDTELKTLEQLEEALSQKGLSLRPTSKQEEQCRRTMENDIMELVPLLEEEAIAARQKAEEMLKERAQKESIALKSLLEDQRKRVLKQREDDDTQGQMMLGFSDDEIRQYRENRKYWDKWLADAEVKLKTEPERISDFYTPVSWRIEPVGIAYLMPSTDRR